MLRRRQSGCQTFGGNSPILGPSFPKTSERCHGWMRASRVVEASVQCRVIRSAAPTPPGVHPMVRYVKPNEYCRGSKRGGERMKSTGVIIGVVALLMATTPSALPPVALVLGED